MSSETELRFAVDVNVGRLAKWLRIMGYDAAYARDMEDNDLIRLALNQGRILLTKDSLITRRRLVTTGHLKAVLITTDNLWEQIRQVVDALGLECHAALTRCIECNLPLEPVPKKELKERVPPYVFQTQEEFVECPSCHKVYWKGTHWSNMREELTRVREGSP